MKIVTLMRHAKASRTDAALHDIQRPLVEKGIQNTSLVIDYLKSINFAPEFILTSSAVRAMETAKMMATAFGIENAFFRQEMAVYVADSDEYYDLCFNLPQNLSHVLIVGHNPSITEFATLFLGTELDSLPTSGVVSILFDAENWTDLPLSSGKMRFVVFPRMIS